MLRSVKDLTRYQVIAHDDKLGRVKDFLVDDRNWQVTHIVISTSRWRFGHKALVPAAFLERADWMSGSLHVGLTRFQIENGPQLEEAVPVSHQHVRDINDYFHLPAAFTGVGQPIATAPHAERARSAVDQIERTRAGIDRRLHPQPAEGGPEEEQAGDGEEGDSAHLRSYDELRTYRIEAGDGLAGRIEDFVLDDATWVFRSVVVGHRAPFTEDRVLLSLAQVTAVSYPERVLKTDLTRDEVHKSPRYDPDEPVNRRTEEVLYDYHGRPHCGA